MLFIALPFSACQTINRSNEELGLPPAMVAFIFDDGPNVHDGTTERLLNVLNKYEIHAMFCLLGENAEAFPELVRRIDREGHVIINHGYSDKWAYRMGKVEFRDNLVLGEAAISTALQKELIPKLYRPHGGFYTSKQERISREAGHPMIPSSVRIYDAVLKGEKKDKAVKKIIKKIEKQNGGIILLHDALDSHFRTEKRLGKNAFGVFNRSWIPDSAEEIITLLLSKGFIMGSPISFIQKYS